MEGIFDLGVTEKDRLSLPFGKSCVWNSRISNYSLIFVKAGRSSLSRACARISNVASEGALGWVVVSSSSKFLSFFSDYSSVPLSL